MCKPMRVEEVVRKRATLESKYPRAHRGASKPGALYHFPWECLGSWGKLILFLPFVVGAVLKDDADKWCMHTCIIVLLRYAHAFLWNVVGRHPYFCERTRIATKSVEFEQVDREANWDDYILLQAWISSAVHWLPWLYCTKTACHRFAGFAATSDRSGWLQLYLWHAGPTEALYYALHRALHGHGLFAAYHSHHHASFVTEPTTGSVHPFAEHLAYTVNFALPLLGTWLTGGFSVAALYAYLMGFDFLNCLGHCNFEVFPPWLYATYSPLRLLLYTPTFHSLHHTKVRANYSLFMPLYDYLGGTVEPRSWTLQRKAWAGDMAQNKTPPSAVFVAHGTDVASVVHLPYVSKALSAKPYALNLLGQLLAWPLAVPTMLWLRLFRTPKPLFHSKYELHHATGSSVKGESTKQLAPVKVAVWTCPAVGLQYAFKSEWRFLNKAIETAIDQADKAGVQVIGLGAMNKNEALNGGGTLFVEAKPDLRVRVVHGNTLTAAAVLACVPGSARTVFCVGATSKLGRALSISLAARGIRVRMLTASRERFDAVVRDTVRHLVDDLGWASDRAEHMVSQHLTRATSVAEGADCRDWLVGKPLTYSEQCHAPTGATFHQFVVPPLEATGAVRRDCAYTPLPAFKLPEKQVKGLRSCEMMMDRGVIFACHAGMLVHTLERWQHHEVGAIDPNAVLTAWRAAGKHSIKLVTQPWQCHVSDSALLKPVMQA